MINVNASTTHLYVITNILGERIAGAENIEDACALMRSLPSGHQIRRLADDAVLAQKSKPYLARPDLRLNVWVRGTA